MKNKLLILWLALVATAFGQLVPPVVEASVAQAAAGTAGAPYYMSPRRVAGIAVGTYLPLVGGTMTGNITFADTGEGLVLHGGGTITGASGAMTLASLAGQNINLTVGTAASDKVLIPGTLDATAADGLAGSFGTLGGASVKKALWVGGLANIAGAVTATSTGSHVFGTTNTVTMAAGALTTTSNAGIGTASPGARLTVKGAGLTSQDFFHIEDSGGVRMLEVVSDASGHAQLQIKETAGTTKILLNSAGDSSFLGGNVGIAMSPVRTLDVTGTFGVTSTATIGGALITTPQTITGSGAINLTTAITVINSTGGGAYSLADGTNGQIKTITMVVDGGDATITPTTTKTGWTTITMDAVADSVTLQFYTTYGWMLASNYNATVNP